MLFTMNPDCSEKTIVVSCNIEIFQWIWESKKSCTLGYIYMPFVECVCNCKYVSAQRPKLQGNGES